uniref:Uncharacterized protein n=2 Tax=Rhizophagus irregularis TaxID=588596 RepID=U9V7Z1_RHIID
MDRNDKLKIIPTDTIEKYMKRCLDEETPESISKPIKENTTPKEVVDIINDFRKEEKYQEIIQTSLINNGHIDIHGTEEGKQCTNIFII